MCGCHHPESFKQPPKSPAQINTNLGPAELISVTATNQKLHGPFAAQNTAEKFNRKDQNRKFTLLNSIEHSSLTLHSHLAPLGHGLERRDNHPWLISGLKE